MVYLAHQKGFESSCQKISQTEVQCGSKFYQSRQLLLNDLWKQELALESWMKMVLLLNLRHRLLVAWKREVNNENDYFNLFSIIIYPNSSCSMVHPARS